MTNAQIGEMVAASDAGAAAGAAIKIGDEFIGAGPAADAAGFVTFGPAWRMFVYSYLLKAPAEIFTDAEGEDRPRYR